MLSFRRLAYRNIFDITSPEDDVLVNLLSRRRRPICGAIFSTKGPHLGEKHSKCPPQPSAFSPVALQAPSFPNTGQWPLPWVPSIAQHCFPRFSNYSTHTPDIFKGQYQRDPSWQSAKKF